MRKDGIVPHLRPDGKTQVTIEYDQEDRPVRLDTVLVSTQHDPEVDHDWLLAQLREHVIEPVLADVLGGEDRHDDDRIRADPDSANEDTVGPEIGGVTRDQIQAAVRKVFDLRPAAIIDELDLLRPIYSKTAAYGHFGRNDPDFTWEQTDKVDELKAAVK